MAMAALAASAVGALAASSRGTIRIAASVAPRTWRAADGALCSNLPANGFGLIDARGERSLPHDPAGRCGAGAASRLDPVRVEPGKILLIVAD